GLSQSHKTEFEKLKYLAGIDLISRRTETVNRLIRYPFIALLIMIAARNDYFDIWNYPLLLLLAWALNVVLALSGALLLYQSADRAKGSVLAGLSKQMIQALGLGKDHEIRAKQVQYIIGEVEANQKGAFVPFYQQPVVESFLYGVVALLQYLYMRYQATHARRVHRWNADTGHRRHRWKGWRPRPSRPAPARLR